MRKRAIALWTSLQARYIITSVQVTQDLRGSFGFFDFFLISSSNVDHFKLYFLVDYQFSMSICVVRLGKPSVLWSGLCDKTSAITFSFPFTCSILKSWNLTLLPISLVWHWVPLSPCSGDLISLPQDTSSLEGSVDTSSLLAQLRASPCPMLSNSLPLVVAFVSRIRPAVFFLARQADLFWLLTCNRMRPCAQTSIFRVKQDQYLASSITVL